MLSISNQPHKNENQVKFKKSLFGRFDRSCARFAQLDFVSNGKSMGGGCIPARKGI